MAEDVVSYTIPLAIFEAGGMDDAVDSALAGPVIAAVAVKATPATTISRRVGISLKFKARLQMLFRLEDTDKTLRRTRDKNLKGLAKPAANQSIKPVDRLKGFHLQAEFAKP